MRQRPTPVPGVSVSSCPPPKDSSTSVPSSIWPQSVPAPPLKPPPIRPARWNRGSAEVPARSSGERRCRSVAARSDSQCDCSRLPAPICSHASGVNCCPPSISRVAPSSYSSRRPMATRALDRCDRASAASVCPSTSRTRESPTDTEKVCTAVRSSGYAAVTVAIAVPATAGESVSVAPVTATVTAEGSEETAA